MANASPYPQNSERPTPRISDPESVRAALQAWLADILGAEELSVSPVKIPDGSGMSNITVLFDIHYTHRGVAESRSVVGRLQAKGDKLVFPGYDLSMQYAMMQYLKGVAQVPSPILIAEENTGTVLGTPFYLMERTEGRVPTDMPSYHRDGWMPELPEEQQREMWFNGIDTMAEVHKLEPSTAEALRFIRRFAFPKSLDEQLQYWAHYRQWTFGDDPGNPVCDRALQWLQQHRPPEQRLSFCWGDARMPNVIFANDSSAVAALLDWEMLTLGDPLQDLAWWIFLDEMFCFGAGAPRLPGLPDRQATAARWAQRTGLSTEQLDYYLVFAGLRFGLIFCRIMRNMGAAEAALDNFVSQYLDKQLQAHL